jgi:acyl-coenzyme A thioesterase PaaI-like protein
MTEPSVEITERRDASAELGAAMREAIVAECATEVPVESLRQAAELARQISALLSVTQRSLTELASVDDLAHSVRYFSPTIGLGNPMAPPLVLQFGDAGVHSRFTLDRRFEGPPGHVHGGVTGLLLDEVMGAAATSAGRWGMTAFLNITYRRALPLDVELEIRSWITEVNGRKTGVTGTIVVAAQPEAICVEATALFIEPRPETQAKYFSSITDLSGAPQSGRHGAPGAE